MMNSNQEKIKAWLTSRSAPLGTAFKAALRLLMDPDFPGRTQLICQAGRDLCSGLGDLHRVPRSTLSDPTTLLREIEALWKAMGMDIRDIAETPESDPTVERAGPDGVLIPRPLFIVLRKLIDEYRRGGVNRRERAEKLFSTVDPAIANRQDAMVPLQNWIELHSWFNTYAHFSVRQGTAAEPELQERFQLLEQFLLGFMQTFYEGMEGLDEILEEANA